MPSLPVAAESPHLAMLAPGTQLVAVRVAAIALLSVAQMQVSPIFFH